MHNFINNNKLNLEELINLSQKPPIFTLGEPLFWNDDHISKGMLEAHLSQDTDAASRRLETIERIVEFISDYLELNDEKNILDIGCGPGLYCSRFYRHCRNITGLDFSKRSLDYAEKYAKEKGLSIKYIFGNYLEMDFKQEFDAIFLIYCDFGVLSDSDRYSLLKRVRRALKPGGHFIFDVFTRFHRGDIKDGSRWYSSSEGFWKPSPHLVLENNFYYKEQDTYLDQYAVIEENGKISLYRVYDHCYSPESIKKVLEENGFYVKDIWSDLSGTAYSNESPSMGISAISK